MTDPRLSVIIPSYCAGAALARCLPALRDQTLDFTFEVLVIDSSPTDELAEVCRPFPFVKLVHLTEKTLPGAARNRGVQEAKGEVCVFLDADVVLRHDALRAILTTYEGGVAAFGGALEAAPGSTIPAGIVEHYFFNHEAQLRRPQGPRANLSSALMVMARKLFLEFGGFKAIPRMQDTELTERMHRAGVSLAFVPAVVGYQLQDSRWKDVCRKVFINGVNLFFIRYAAQKVFPGKALLFLLLPFISLFKSLRIIGRHLLYQDAKGRLVAFAISPLILFLGFVWGLGLLRSLLLGGAISTKR